MTQTFDHFYKLLFVGNSRSGKTALISKLSQKACKQDYRMSIGIPKTCCCLTTPEWGRIQFVLWENPGNDDFSSCSRILYRAANAVVIVYATHSRASFDGVQRWLREIQQYTLHRYAKPRVHQYLIGCIASNKTREVAFDEGTALAQTQGLIFTEVQLTDQVDAETLLKAIYHISL